MPVTNRSSQLPIRIAYWQESLASTISAWKRGIPFLMKLPAGSSSFLPNLYAPIVPRWLVTAVDVYWLGGCFLHLTHQLYLQQPVILGVGRDCPLFRKPSHGWSNMALILQQFLDPLDWFVFLKPYPASHRVLEERVKGLPSKCLYSLLSLYIFSRREASFKLFN